MAKLDIIVIVFLALVSCIPRSHGFYWRLRPEVNFYIGSSTDSVVGYYAEYGYYETQIRSAQLVIVEDTNFGCGTSLSQNATAAISVATSSFVIMLPRDANACSDYHKAYYAQRTGAVGVLFYSISSSTEDKPNFSRGSKLSIPVAAIEITEENFNILLESIEGDSSQSLVSIIGKYYQTLPTSQTFYFVVFSFCILTILSCLWFILSYVRKCRTNAQRRRRRVQTERETRDLVNSLPVKSHKCQLDDDDAMCAICLDMFHNKDTIRVLPCGHEFHKKCIDPWLKLKRTCPMCKEDISKSKESRAQLQRRPTSDSIHSDASDLQLLSPDTSSNLSIDTNNDVVIEDLDVPLTDNGQSTVIVFEDV